MDFSKLPKLSESPAPPEGKTPSQSQAYSQPMSYAQPAVQSAPTPRSQGFEYALDAFISLIVGGIFFMLGHNYLRYLTSRMSGTPLDTGITWTSGEKAGQNVEYFDLQGGTAWGDMGFFILGAALVLAALVLMLSLMSPRLRRGLLMFAVFLAVAGAVANVVAVVMQMKQNVQPMISMVAILVGGMLAFFFGRHLVEDVPPARQVGA